MNMMVDRICFPKYFFDDFPNMAVSKVGIASLLLNQFRRHDNGVMETKVVIAHRCGKCSFTLS